MKEHKYYVDAGMIVAKNVGAYRFMLGLDYNQFAVRTGLTPDRIRDLEAGKDTLANGIELLRIAEACNIQYTDLFENEKTKVVSARNARFPEEVWAGIYKLARTQFSSSAALARTVGVHSSTPNLWYKGKAHPQPFVFQNLITLLKLKACDLEAMVKKPAELEESLRSIEAPKVTKVEPATVSAYITNENMIDPDTFENKVIKIMKLQKELDHFVDRLDKINQAVYELRNELKELV